MKKAELSKYKTERLQYFMKSVIDFFCLIIIHAFYRIKSSGVSCSLPSVCAK